MKKKGHHEKSHWGKTDTWLTDPAIIKALGPFDLDPSSPVRRPWDTAAKHYTILDNGLSKNWKGRVWMNPPYGPATKIWLAKLSRHGNGIALVAARVETHWFHEFAWQASDGILFLRGRVVFYTAQGQPGIGCTHPSVLIAYGRDNAERLQTCGIEGHFVPLTPAPAKPRSKGLIH